MTPNPDIAVSVLDESASRDAGLVDQLNTLINGVYASAERGLWRDGATRTTPTEIAELIAAGQVAVATTRDGRIVGSVHVHQVSDDTGEFGMLVAAPDHRGVGIGRHLIDFAEHYSRQRHLRAIQLEVLVPRAGRHPSKQFLKSWYARRGYRLIHTRSIDETHPHLAPLLATPCDLEVHEKPLHRQGTTTPRRPPTFGVILPRAAARRLAAGRSFSETSGAGSNPNGGRATEAST